MRVDETVFSPPPGETNRSGVRIWRYTGGYDVMISVGTGRGPGKCHTAVLKDPAEARRLGEELIALSEIAEGVQIGIGD